MPGSRNRVRIKIMFSLFNRFFGGKNSIPKLLPSDYIAKGWTQRDIARDVYGQSVGVSNPEAISWCIIGAMSIALVRDNNNYTTYRDEVALVLLEKGYQPTLELSTWNDGSERTQEEVYDLCKAVEFRLGL